MASLICGPMNSSRRVLAAIELKSLDAAALLLLVGKGGIVVADCEVEMPQMSIKCVAADSSSTADAPICIWDCRCGHSVCAARKGAQWTASCRENGILMHPAHGELIEGAQENSLAAVSASCCV
ncbi:hypothetical protein ACLKA6_015976 [Drosophila palustris]